MAVRIPGGYRYAPADLGIDALVVALSSNVDALVVPWNAAFAYSRLALIVQLASAGAVNVTLRIRIFDFDGVTNITGATPFSVVTAITGTPTVVLYGLDTARAQVGTPGVTGIPAMLTAPYLQFNVQNVDAANAVTVTMQALFLSGVGE